MAELKLNTSTSIVDFLKSQGKASDFTSRKSLYESSGLSQRLGPYVSSGNQNIAFLKSLNTPTATGAVTPSKVNPGGVPVPTLGSTVTDTQGRSGIAAYDPNTGKPLSAPTQIEQPIGNSGITATQAASSIPQTPSADEILSSVLNSAGFQNFQQGQELDKTLGMADAQAQKQKLDVQTAADTKAFTNSMGRRGLFFSSETTEGLNALAESLASSKLGIDRKLAGDLLRSDMQTKGEIIDQVSALVKEAQNGRKEAISALEKVGLTVIGDQIVPTMAARNAEFSQSLNIEKEQRIAQQQEFNNQIAQARLELSQAKGDLQIQQLELRIEKLNKAKVDNADTEIADATAKLTGARGSDGYTDPNLYASLRQSSSMNPTQFDNRFGYLVNPLSRDRLGLGTVSKSGLSADQVGAINDAKSVIDQTKYQFGDAVGTRQKIIDTYLQQTGFDLSPYL